MRVLDLFCGAGGFSLGFKQEGFTCQGIDFWDTAITSYRENIGEAECRDLKRVVIQALPKHIDVLIGSPPCVEFSSANVNGDIYEGLLLVYKFLEIVCYIRPKFWIMENVPEVQRFIPRFIGKQMKTLNAADFGTCQKRLRSFIGNYPNVKLTHSENHVGLTLFEDNIRKWNTLADVLDVQREREKGFPSENRFGDVVMSWKDTSNTITCISRYFIKDDTQVSLLDSNDLKLVQGFPKDYIFNGSESDKRRQIGNAVSPNVSRAIARACKQALTVQNEREKESING